MVHIISLGAGVQSSTMALMAAVGEITPMPDAAIFADTQAEPQSVYTWLDWLETQLPFPVHRVTAGNLAEAPLTLRTSKTSGNIYTKSLIPTFIKSPSGTKGMMIRQCTRDYKIVPITKKMRELCAITRAKATMPILAYSWIGISADEAHRMKPSTTPFIENIWPLVERRMSRQDCLRWMESRGYPEPPRSACVFCPYHSDNEWLRLKTNEPESFAFAVEWEQKIQAVTEQDTVTNGIPFLHSSLRPLNEVEFVTGQGELQFGNECEGMCGV